VFCTDLSTNSNFCLINIKRLVFITKWSVYSAVRTESLYITDNLRLYRVNEYNAVFVTATPLTLVIFVSLAGEVTLDAIETCTATNWLMPTAQWPLHRLQWTATKTASGRNSIHTSPAGKKSRDGTLFVHLCTSDQLPTQSITVIWLIKRNENRDYTTSLLKCRYNCIPSPPPPPNVTGMLGPSEELSWIDASKSPSSCYSSSVSLTTVYSPSGLTILFTRLLVMIITCHCHTSCARSYSPQGTNRT
jgi:hypothetical protein